MMILHEEPFDSQDLLLHGLRSKDRTAYEYFYDRYSAALYGILCRIVGDEKIAEEVLQETFLDFWHTIALYEPEMSSLFTRAIRIATHKAHIYKKPKSHD